MKQTHSNLSIATLDKEQHERTCNYWFCVQSDNLAHTAFTTRAGFERWMMERGLSITQELPLIGTHSYQKIVGSYREESHMSYDEFFALNGFRTRTLSNGDYTLAIITDDEDGLKTVHTLNPNCHDRPVFNYFESSALYK